MSKKDADDLDFYERMTPEEKAEFEENCQQLASVIMLSGTLCAILAIIILVAKICTFLWNLI